MEDQALVYNRLYGEGYHRDLNGTHALPLCKWLDENIAFDSILDVGCSHGWVLRRYAKTKRVAGVDISSVIVQRCISMGLEAYATRANALPFADNSFDVVMSTDCFEHIEPEHVPASIKEACRVAKKCVAMKISTKADTAHWRNIVKQPLHLTIESIAWWEERFHEAFVEAKGPNVHITRFFDHQTFVVEVIPE